MASNKFGVTYFDRDWNPGEESGMAAHHPSHEPTSGLDYHHPNPPSPPDQETVARFAQIREDLADISGSVDIRNQLKRIGRTTPNLGLFLPNNDGWRSQTTADECAFHRIKNEVDSFSGDKFPSKGKLKEWEDKIEPLLERTKNNSNDKANAGFRDSRKIDASGIFKAKADWSWESATGRGTGEDEAVSPKEENMNPFEDAGKYSHLYDRIGAISLEEDDDEVPIEDYNANF
ncbi:hypothetical protein BDV96DRAFT_653370 [Lophiotrema nucula]|uniref:Uncharacterized protein n=1 Tax=Lophiotrema nucula TaxID=690887 RepID=A0A6A5YNU9_9PLEO|nr:hypothetical protein BDV96DRAFT_653370 [Lophiotrema nucula]